MEFASVGEVYPPKCRFLSADCHVQYPAQDTGFLHDSNVCSNAESLEVLYVHHVVNPQK